jgi:cytochrome P460
MTYRKPEGPPAGEPTFDNVFVNPEAHAVFKRTGRWPDPTIFVIEVRSSRTHGSINEGGRFQSDLRGLEVEVKDGSRFPDGWAYFGFEPGSGTPAAARALPQGNRCYACHHAHGAVENTFVQFYPTLLAAAREMNTLNPGFEQDEKDEGEAHP